MAVPSRNKALNETLADLVTKAPLLEKHGHMVAHLLSSWQQNKCAEALDYLHRVLSTYPELWRVADAYLARNVAEASFSLLVLDLATKDLSPLEAALTHFREYGPRLTDNRAQTATIAAHVASDMGAADRGIAAGDELFLAASLWVLREKIAKNSHSNARASFGPGNATDFIAEAQALTPHFARPSNPSVGSKHAPRSLLELRLTRGPVLLNGRKFTKPLMLAAGEDHGVKKSIFELPQATLRPGSYRIELSLRSQSVCQLELTIFLRNDAESTHQILSRRGLLTTGRNLQTVLFSFEIAETIESSMTLLGQIMLTAPQLARLDIGACKLFSVT